MHVVFRESHNLEETDGTPFDMGQTPADMVVLSFSDSDLGAFAAGWHRGKVSLPSLRLGNLVALRHPLSVDTYVENTLCGAKAILVRIIGGEQYWPYGVTALRNLALKHHIALAILPADGRPDPALDQCSTLPLSTLRRLSELCDAGGAVAAQAALAQLALAAGMYASPVLGEKQIPSFGFYVAQHGVLAAAPVSPNPDVVVVFYRSYLTAADMDAIDALLNALSRSGFNAYGAFVPSLKAPGVSGWLKQHLGLRPAAAIVNATAFSAQGPDGTTPFDEADCPAFQVALSTARRRDWATSDRGLSSADLAMHVVLPEVDGRLFAGLISFKSPGKRDPDLQFSRFAHRSEPALLEAAVARLGAWHRLAVTRGAERQLAIILSTYPGRAHQMAHAVGLDAIASVEALLLDMADDGYATGTINPHPFTVTEALQRETLSWPVKAYRKALARLPRTLQDQLSIWGNIEDDPACVDGNWRFKAFRRGKVLVALQPERGHVAGREASYHDLSGVPCHGYVAFYLWLQDACLDAMVHMGAHGTLEWLPGKSVALSQECWPTALTGDLPVIYPFIVNDPGEAAQAKRRIGAVALGHLPPPQMTSRLPVALTALEGLLDEYSTAYGLDPQRRNRLVSAILEQVSLHKLDIELGLAADAAPADILTRIDRFVCDIKESQFGVGLHVWGRGDCGPEERAGLMAALAGRRVPPGPSGSPERGRADVLPTGRNMFSVDPRAVPSRIAHVQGIKLANELVRRHLQDHGDYPRSLVVNLWGSATMRTAGEEFAMALHLAGLAPVWDAGSGRVSGYEVLPLAILDRPRIDVTLRISGLFRDVFPGLAQLFEAAALALAKRHFEADENPYLRREARVFGPKPGEYGAGNSSVDGDFSTMAREQAGEAWLAASSWAIGIDGLSRQDRNAIEVRVRAADAYVHLQDMPETDILLAADYAAHQGGFAAASAALGGTVPSLYHLDNTRPEAPRARLLSEEIARIVRGRASNPAWASGMMAHGFRGAAEIAATLEHLAQFAHLTKTVPPHLFDLYYDATLGRPDIRAFLAEANCGALAAMEDVFRRLRDAGVWNTQRNSIVAALEPAQ